MIGKYSAAEQPQTKAEALALAQAWGHTLSHWNACAGRSESADSGAAIAEAARADAAEVQRLAALWTMLPEEYPD